MRPPLGANQTTRQPLRCSESSLGYRSNCGRSSRIGACWATPSVAAHVQVHVLRVLDLRAIHKNRTQSLGRAFPGQLVQHDWTLAKVIPAHQTLLAPNLVEESAWLLDLLIVPRVHVFLVAAARGRIKLRNHRYVYAGLISVLRRGLLTAQSPARFPAGSRSRIRGGGGDETDVAISLANACLSRPSGYPRPAVEIHTDDLETTETSLSSMAEAIRRKIALGLRPGQKVRLALWQKKLLHRRLIAGVNTESSTGQRERSPKWGLAMDHVARKTDDPDSIDPAAWHLLRRDALGTLYSQYLQTARPASRVVDVHA